MKSLKHRLYYCSPTHEFVYQILRRHFDIYLDYFSPDDIHQYSIDEAFIDVTDYLSIYKLEPKQLAKKIINEIAERTHIPATCGIGTNLYLAKIALDITAKHCKDHIGMLDEQTFKETLWEHRPITDFWNIANGIATRLARYGIHDMKGVATAPEDLLYRNFGKNAKLLIDHANGKESCTIADIKNYKGKSKSISNSQILFSDYAYDKAHIVIQEMALSGCQRLLKEHLIASHVGISVGYSKDAAPATGGTLKMANSTNLYSMVKEYVDRILKIPHIKTFLSADSLYVLADSWTNLPRAMICLRIWTHCKKSAMSKKQCWKSKKSLVRTQCCEVSTCKKAQRKKNATN